MDSPSTPPSLASENLALSMIASSEKSENCSKSDRSAALTFSAVKTEESCGGNIKLLWRFRRNGSEVASSETVQEQAAASQSQPQRQSSIESTQSRSVSDTPKMEKAKMTQTKRCLFFALSKYEIQADLLAISGGSPPIPEQSPPAPEISRPAREKANKNQRKRRFSFALSLDEIRADILAVTGKEPVTPIKKRAKKIPKEIEILFPSFRGFN